MEYVITGDHLNSSNILTCLHTRKKNPVARTQKFDKSLTSNAHIAGLTLFFIQLLLPLGSLTRYQKEAGIGRKGEVEVNPLPTLRPGALEVHIPLLCQLQDRIPRLLSQVQPNWFALNPEPRPCPLLLQALPALRCCETS